jgi:hypothetical protein
MGELCAEVLKLIKFWLFIIIEIIKKQEIEQFREETKQKNAEHINQ